MCLVIFPVSEGFHLPQALSAVSIKAEKMTGLGSEPVTFGYNAT